MTKRKLILRCDLSPGDIVMLTAAVRDLHRSHPDRFVTDVRTRCPEIWEHNPWLMPIPDADPEATTIECEYPLINESNTAPYHCLHGFRKFLSAKLDVVTRPAGFHGDLHISDLE